ncbi:cAMP phosphodiesterase class-II [Colletotrichum karsti]|uniref:cAMP phosphodiesterase class-II n=1 Tax=Colletotrichum karsti TaxID=1095194 RepID=A0A9P6HWV3_9PEZI|nr:cAMP phosphodiesterase class-II [Colletotrichum karsti]KAF9872963.1 cAMP phosphodiesterase class-II [Colletotrichum karsti]
MADTNGEPEKAQAQAHPPALHVIVLGAGGGPQENNTTALLVRSVASGWTRRSIISVDAGVHLSAITNILEKTVPAGLSAETLPHTLTDGPFKGLELTAETTSFYPSTIAAYITRSLIETYVITHPHLDHIAGFVVNTAGLTRQKRLAALPTTINAFKNHIFNNIIWPNLSDENNGAGLVTYIRLVEGGSPAIGDGEAKGYLEVGDNLLAKVWSVSHGHCIEHHPHRGSTSSAATPHRYGSVDGASMASPRILAHGFPPSTGPMIPRAASVAPEPMPSECVYDSSAYFIQDYVTKQEILIFGDVEPDSISLSPRNERIWKEAASKIAAGQLAAIFIECSYDESQSVDRLFGHMKPSYLIEELRALAYEVRQVDHLSRKRKRDPETVHRRRTGGPLSRVAHGDESPISPKSVAKRALSTDIPNVPPLPPLPPSATSVESSHLTTPTETELGMSESEDGLQGPSLKGFLKGVKIVVIHVKERLDGTNVGAVIERELLKFEEKEQLGCEFIISKPGESIYL